MYKYVFSFLLYLVLVISYLFTQYNNKLVVQYDYLEDSFQKSLNGAVNSFELLNDAYHNENESAMAYIIRDAGDSSLKERDKIRYRLREKFTTFYNNRKLSEFSTFHIFDKYGRSILRFHRLDKYDDFIINKRDSLKNMLLTFKSQKGFEVGEYASTYRFQYPLFYDGSFVGCYEFGIEFEAINVEMKKLFGIDNILFVDKKYIDNVSTAQTTKDRYEKVFFKDDFFYELKSNTKPKDYIDFKKSINLHNITISDKKVIRFSSNDKDYIAMFNPLNDITGKKIGFIMTFVEDNLYRTILRTFIEELVVAILLGFLVIYFVYEEIEYKKYIRNIIDTQKDILLVTDGDIIKDVNQAFLDFFSVNSIREFIKQGSKCVCDRFVKEDGYLQKNMGDKSWIEYINTFKDREHIAIMKSQDGSNRYFKIEINGFSKSNDFIVIFYDVTDDLKKKKELENKAYYDNLTGVYSRERFDFFLNEKLNQKREFSLIMFDIDHFKLVNDTYGHDIGDSVLTELTKLIFEHIREEDIFARWGGEEFMIIVSLDLKNAKRFAQKLRKIIELHTFKGVNHITCSFGIAEYKRYDSFEKLIKKVDKMLYLAKNSGRNCVMADKN